ncbi:hypothetical protein RSOLAG1IB_06271 [Rhizoctonia solani AG-1 IB]|uniref:Uncharacterized protein n=1 Tax=Thanatephorus cucumeris (strain AG1-IB / isolate 7/3/14) TaxID=1108050 RepID=A0A0B7F8R8_THACB|nr:hypothetical protein RSOLAG1IB_06271 [Rhizoctonia solani AG-1 IB]
MNKDKSSHNKNKNVPKGADANASVLDKAAGKGSQVASNRVKATRRKETSVVGQDAHDAWERFQNEYDDGYSRATKDPNGVIPTCDKKDCRDSYFMNEASRWAKQAINDIWRLSYDHPIVTAVTLAGASIIVVELVSGGIIVKATLRAIGFGAKGPIKNSIASKVQRMINPVKSGSIFSNFQSAGMGGALFSELNKAVHTRAIMLIGVAIAGFIAYATDPHSHSAGPRKWREWMSKSKVDDLLDIPTEAAQFWGTHTHMRCVAYGYKEIHASLNLSFIQEKEDPLAACTQTPALIDGIGYKTPFGCIEVGTSDRVVGIWYVPTATYCMPKWSVFEDEGCRLYGRRRKFARLIGLTNRDDWMAVCESTPATVDGKDYGGPSYCDDKLQGVLGAYGVFDVVDKGCECSCVRV